MTHPSDELSPQVTSSVWEHTKDKCGMRWEPKIHFPSKLGLEEGFIDVSIQHESRKSHVEFDLTSRNLPVRESTVGDFLFEKRSHSREYDRVTLDMKAVTGQRNETGWSERVRLMGLVSVLG